MSKVIKFKGASYFRQRIVCSTLSGQAILIREIREREEKPGLTEYEASLLRLVEKVTNGCVIEIDHTGTQVYYKPGAIVGGRVTHDCGRERAIGYFLEALVCLAPFGKAPLIASLSGITNHHNNLDISVDLFRTVTLPTLRHFGVNDGLHFKIVKRGAPPNAGGLVEFTCPIVKALKPIQLTADAKVKRVRGIAYATRISPQFANRMGEAAKGTLLKFSGDVFIYTDHYKGKDSGSSPGFGLSLVAETTAGTLFSAETMGASGVSPEDVANESCQLLMQELMMGGAVDTMHQPMTFLLMTLSPEDISKVRVGKLSQYSIEMLRNIRKFFGVTFKIEPDVESKTVIVQNKDTEGLSEHTENANITAPPRELKCDITEFIQKEEALNCYSIHNEGLEKVLNAVRKEHGSLDWLESSLLENETVLKTFRNIGALQFLPELLRSFKYFYQGTKEQNQKQFIKDIWRDAEGHLQYLRHSEYARFILMLPKEAVDQFVLLAVMETLLEPSFEISGRTVQEWCELGAVVLHPYHDGWFTVHVPPLWYENYSPRESDAICRSVRDWVRDKTTLNRLTQCLILRVAVRQLTNQTVGPISALLPFAEGPSNLLQRTVAMPSFLHCGATFYGYEASTDPEDLDTEFTKTMPVEYNCLYMVHLDQRRKAFKNLKFILLPDPHKPNHNVVLFVKCFEGAVGFAEANESYASVKELWDETMSEFGTTAAFRGKALVSTYEVLQLVVADKFANDGPKFNTQTMLVETSKMSSVFGGFGPYMALYK